MPRPRLRLTAMLLSAAALGAPLALTAPASASAAVAPLDRGWINDSTTWLVHVDVERLLTTEIGRWLAREIEESDAEMEANAGEGVELNLKIGNERRREKERKVVIERHIGDAGGDEGANRGAAGLEALMPQSLRDLRERYHFDPLTDILSITLFGSDDDDRPENLLVHTTAAIDAAVKELQKVEGVEISHLNGVTVGQLDADDESGAPKFIAVQPEADGSRIMFFADSLDELAATVASKGKLRAPDWIAPAPDSFIYIHASKGSPFLEDAVNSQMLRDAESVEINIGQRAGNLFMSGVLQTGSNEVATNMAQVANGLLALARLGAMQSDELDEETRAMLDIVKGLSIKTDASDVRLDLSMDAGTIVKFLESESD